ncbi:MAG: prepilin-type N-terminal cleavage/methylation domain-containing protein [Deltaproteobacteria bacterium]|nr:prepilin-type N-terminal cleavage/methylation domain-containing protein [Deltaproteobacteria bacterium]
MNSNSRQKNRGFTLIELMLVVAIIGILVAIAIPNFMRYQTRTKQVEARHNLGAIYTAEIVYFGDRQVFSDLPSLAWRAEGRTRYSYLVTNWSSTAFTAQATGNIDTDPFVDLWTINHRKELRNSSNDVTN